MPKGESGQHVCGNDGDVLDTVHYERNRRHHDGSAQTVEFPGSGGNRRVSDPTANDDFLPVFHRSSTQTHFEARHTSLDRRLHSDFARRHLRLPQAHVRTAAGARFGYSPIEF